MHEVQTPTANPLDEPEGQGLQPTNPSGAPGALYVPGLQLLQIAVPAAALYVPEGQVLQIVAPDPLYVPEEHEVQLANPDGAPGALYVPAPQM